MKHQSALPSPALSTERKRQTHLDQFQASFPSPHLQLPSNQARPDSSRHTNVERSSSDANSGQRSANSNNRRTRDETNGRRFPRLDSTRVIPRSSPQGRTWCACEVVKWDLQRPVPEDQPAGGCTSSWSNCAGQGGYLRGQPASQRASKQASQQAKNRNRRRLREKCIASHLHRRAAHPHPTTPRLVSISDETRQHGSRTWSGLIWVELSWVELSWIWSDLIWLSAGSAVQGSGLIDWLIGWLIDWLIDWLTDRTNLTGLHPFLSCPDCPPVQAKHHVDCCVHHPGHRREARSEKRSEKSLPSLIRGPSSNPARPQPTAHHPLPTTHYPLPPNSVFRAVELPLPGPAWASPAAATCCCHLLPQCLPFPCCSLDPPSHAFPGPTNPRLRSLWPVHPGRCFGVASCCLTISSRPLCPHRSVAPSQQTLAPSLHSRAGPAPTKNYPISSAGSSSTTTLLPRPPLRSPPYCGETSWGPTKRSRTFCARHRAKHRALCSQRRSPQLSRGPRRGCPPQPTNPSAGSIRAREAESRPETRRDETRRE